MIRERKIILFIATSLDGYIAGPDGDISWLKSDQDYGYSDFAAGIDAVVMGRKSYEVSLGFGCWLFPGMKAYVFTRNASLAPHEDVEYVSSPVAEFAGALKEKPGKNIWLLGGGELVQGFLDSGLVDEAVITIHPVILGGGVPLVPQGTVRRTMKLTNVKSYDTGLVQAFYEFCG